MEKNVFIFLPQIYLYPFLFRSSRQRNARRQVQHLFSYLFPQDGEAELVMGWSVLTIAGSCGWLPAAFPDSLCPQSLEDPNVQRQRWEKVLHERFPTSFGNKSHAAVLVPLFYFHLLVFHFSVIIFISCSLFLGGQQIRFILNQGSSACQSQWKGGANPKCERVEIFIVDICNHRLSISLSLSSVLFGDIWS